MGFQEVFNERVIPAAERTFGVQVTLSHGEWVTEEFTALWEDRKYELSDAEGFVTTYQTRIFTFAVAAAVFLGEAFEPRAGDKLRWTENGVEKCFEVSPPPGMKATELLPGGYRWKVHTKQIN